MFDAQVVWDPEDDPQGNVQHIARHNLSMDEVEEVLLKPQNPVTTSRSSGRPIAFGYTSTGKDIAVIFIHENGNPLWLYPITAYEANEPRTRR